MLASLRRLLAEQTTATELASFVLVVTVLCVLAAVLAYVVIMTLVWLARLRRQHTWRQVVLPDLIRFRRFTWEYLLALATSAVLALTLADKHEIVDAVLNQPADSLLGTHELRALLPLHRTPTVAELGDSAAAETETFAAYLEGRATAAFNLRVAALLRPPLLAGREGEVRAVVDEVLRTVLERNPSLRTRLRQWLLIACFLLFAAYLGWYVGSRTREIRRAGAGASSGGDAVRRFALIGVCVALLLATPALARDADALAEATLDAIRGSEPPPGPASTADTLLTRAIDAQYELQGALRALADFRDSATVMGALGGLGARLSALDRSLTDVGDRTRALTVDLNGLRDEVGSQRAALLAVQGETRALTAALDGLRRDVGALKDLDAQRQGRLDGLSTRLDAVAAQAARAERLARELEARLASVRDTELLLVEAGGGATYSIARAAGGGAVARGSVRGAHRLRPDTYVVSAPGYGTQRVTLSAGTPQWVVLLPVVQ